MVDTQVRLQAIVRRYEIRIGSLIRCSRVNRANVIGSRGIRHPRILGSITLGHVNRIRTPIIPATGGDAKSHDSQQHEPSTRSDHANLPNHSCCGL
jgi:hypothetical protein